VANIGTGQGVTVNHIFKTLSDSVGNTIEPRHGPPRPGDVRNFWLDSSRAKQVLGWAPKVTFEEGVRLTVESFR
jgi:UDP-glucose 4-epimerase